MMGEIQCVSAEWKAFSQLYSVFRLLCINNDRFYIFDVMLYLNAHLFTLSCINPFGSWATGGFAPCSPLQLII